MKHNKYTLTEKKFYKAQKELWDVIDKIKGLPYTPIDKPYQHGWYLVIVLREDYLRSTPGPIVKGLLSKIRVTGVTTNAKLVSSIRKHSNLEDVRAMMYNKRMGGWPGAPFVHCLSKREWEKLPAQQRKYFDHDPFIAAHNPRKEYSFNLPLHYLLVKVQKRIITHVQDISPALEREKARLNKILMPYWRTLPYGDGFFHWHGNRQDRRKTHVQMHHLAIDDEYEY